MTDKITPPIPPAQPQPDKPMVSQVPMPQPLTPKRKGRPIALILLVIILLVAGAAYLLGGQKLAPAPKDTKIDVPLIRYGLPNEVGIPQYPTNALGSTTTVEINAQMFEGLVGYTNQTNIKPLLATSWTNPDNSTWVFTLRSGVKFHTGRNMTAEDVKYTLDYAVAHQGDNDGGSVLSIAGTIKSTDVIGSNKVKITTNGPDPVLLSRLSFLGIIDSKAKPGDFNAGTGPYVVKSGTTPSEDTIDLAAANEYWQGHVSTRELQIKLYKDTSALAQDAQDGKLDLAGDFNTSQIAKIKPIQTLSIPDEGVNFLGLNTAKPGSPLQSLQAREAVAEALNIPAILKTSDIKGEQASQLVPLLLPGHDPSIKNTSLDTSKSKSLLSAVPNKSTPLTLAYPSGDEAQANEIATELKAVGFNVQPTLVDDLNELITKAFDGHYDMYTYGYSSSTQDGLDILSSVLSKNKSYVNPQIDDLIEKASTTLDQKERIQDMQKVAMIVSQDKPVVPLFTQDRQYAVMKPLVIKPDMPGMDTGVYFWKVYQK